jgi:hypothetical protein
MRRRVAAAAPVHAFADEAVAAIVDLGPDMFPQKVDVDDSDGFSVGEKVNVSMARLAPYTWSVEFSPVGHSRWLPQFDGRLTIVRAGNGVQLVLRGVYTPPLGWIGAIADQLAGGRVARRSIDRFLHDAAAEVDRHACDRRESGPTRMAPYPPDLRTGGRAS